MVLFRRRPKIEEVDEKTGEVRVVRKESKPLPTWAKVVIGIIVLYMLIALLTPVNPLSLAKYYFIRFLEWLNTPQMITFRRWIWITGFIAVVWISARLFYLFMPTLYLTNENKFLTVFRTKEGEGTWSFWCFEWIDWPPRPRLYRFDIPVEWIQFYYKMYVVRHPKDKPLIRIYQGRTIKIDTEDREAVLIDILEKELRQIRKALEIEREENLKLRRQLAEVGLWVPGGQQQSE